MYAYELFEQIKAEAVNYKNRRGVEAMSSVFNALYDSLVKQEYFSSGDASDAVIGAVACVMANDGRISRTEYEYFRNVHSAFEPMTYDQFFNMMSKYNRKENRDRTVMYFDRIRTPQIAMWFIMLCIMAAIVDGNVALNEELFCESLCEIYLNKFER